MSKRTRTDSDSTTQSSSDVHYPQARKSILRKRRIALAPGSTAPAIAFTAPLNIPNKPRSLSPALAVRVKADTLILNTILFHVRHIGPFNNAATATPMGTARSQLANCALVCRQWLLLARPYFLPSLLLHQCNKSTFLTLTSSPSSTISQHIHTLTLVTRIPPLCFQDPTKFRNIRTLKIMECTFESLHEVGNLITSFRNLQSLELSNIDWIDTPPWISFSHTHETLPPQLHTMELYLPQDGLCAELINWFMSFRVPPKYLHTLKFGGQLGRIDISSIQILLEFLGSRLKRLYLYNTKLQGVDLSQTASLETLSLSHILSKSLHQHGIWLSSLSRLSLSTSSTSIKELKFHLVDGYYDSDLELIDWSAFNRILERFSGLMKLEFAGTQGGGKKVARRELAKWKEKGVLVLSC